MSSNPRRPLRRDRCRTVGRLLVGIAASLAIASTAGAATDKDAAQGAGPAQAEYLKLHPDFVVNVRGGGRVRYLLATVQVMSRDAGILDAAKHHLPALRHELLLLLSEQTYDQLRGVESRKALQDAALTAVNGVLEREEASKQVEGLYFTNFVLE
ncbi:MAG: flagellar basal body-associated FliL family protein [Chromatiales bacterium]|nr:flagellar basal body-associated FliL family protein [Chromatiales bacterium]